MVCRGLDDPSNFCVPGEQPTSDIVALNTSGPYFQHRFFDMPSSQGMWLAWTLETSHAACMNSLEAFTSITNSSWLFHWSLLQTISTSQYPIIEFNWFMSSIDFLHPRPSSFFASFARSWSVILNCFNSWKLKIEVEKSKELWIAILRCIHTLHFPLHFLPYETWAYPHDALTELENAL